MEQRAAEAPLGMAGELPVVEGQVGRVDGDVRDTERIRECAQKRCVTACDVGKAGTRIEGEDQSDVETAGAEDDGPASGIAAEEGNPGGGAHRGSRPGVGSAVPGKHHGGRGGFPKEDLLRRLSGWRRTPGRCVMRVEGRQFLVDAVAGRQHPEVGQFHGGWRYNPDTRR